MTIQINFKDYAQEYLPFNFPGFWNEGFCYLRVEVKNGKVIFLCSQLPNYNGTSITNAVENIRRVIVNKLIDENILSINISVGTFEKFILKESDIEDRKLEKLEKYLSENTTWIEHYPEGEGLSDSGSYSIVHFSDSGEPRWSYLSKEFLEKKFKGFELNVPIDRMKQWES